MAKSIFAKAATSLGILPEEGDSILSRTSTGDSAMSKPSSYFSIQEHTFQVPGRKENKGKSLEQKELALYFEKEVMAIPFQPMPTVPAKMKYVRLAGLKEIAAVLASGYPEETTAVVLKEKGYKELVQTLKENKVLVLDFCQFVKDELAKVPAKPRGRQAGSGTGSSKSTANPDVRLLVSILSGLAPNESPKELANRLSNLVEDEEKMEKAVSILTEKEAEHGRQEGFIMLRTRKAGTSKIQARNSRR